MPSHASGTTDESSGRFGRILGRLTKSSAQLQADDLHHASVRRGATPIAELVPRQRATVCGEVRTVALRPQIQVPALVVELFDGTGSLSLVWLGRRAVVGIIPGVKLRVETCGVDRRSTTPPTRSSLTMADPGLDPVGHTGESAEVARVDPAAPFVTVEELLRARLGAAFGGWRGALESAVPTLAFVVAWNLTADVRMAAILAVVAAVLIGVVRVMQGQTLRYVGWSVAAVVVAGVFATRTGRAQDAFLPGMLQSGFSLLLFAVSNLIRWPLFGFLIAAGDPDLARTSARVRFAGSKEGRAALSKLDDVARAEAEAAAQADADALTHAFTAWRRHAGIVRVASRLGWVLVGLAALRLSIQIPLYLQGSVEALGIAKLVLGWPAYLLAVGVGAMVLLRGRTPLDDPTR